MGAGDSKKAHAYFDRQVLLASGPFGTVLGAAARANENFDLRLPVEAMADTRSNRYSSRTATPAAEFFGVRQAGVLILNRSLQRCTQGCIAPQDALRLHTPAHRLVRFGFRLHAVHAPSPGRTGDSANDSGRHQRCLGGPVATCAGLQVVENVRGRGLPARAGWAQHWGDAGRLSPRRSVPFMVPVQVRTTN